jgi:ATP-dependent Clp protease ATP-binding subunit ClpA
MKENEADELLLLEEKIRKQVIGQERAVSDVSAAIRRARVRIGEIERPIAVFLFVGPTGVGKTELAKALAEIYFGAKEKMIRLDMSEFATPYDIERLLGNTGGSVSGLLTEQVRKSPFSLVLLDEFEKASSNIWDLFLQIFDDGRITDGMGRVVNFTNTIIIATSNVGSRQILENLAQGGSQESIQELVQKELLTVFRPEFINRFDDVVTFNPLSKDNIKEVSLLEIKNLNQRLGEEQGLTVVLAEDALDHLAEIGYSPKFGARFLKRLMREKIEDALVVGILKNQYPRGSVVTITKEQLVK